MRTERLRCRRSATPTSRGPRHRGSLLLLRPPPRAMPKSDTWPGGVAMEPLSNLDSAGSCDSVISVNSGYSQDSMEHLSPEERACLMFFEETIEALEVQEDSGISNDEPDSVFLAGPGVNGVSGLKSNAYKEEPGTKVFSVKDHAEHPAPNRSSGPQSFPTSAANANVQTRTPTHPVSPPKPPRTEPPPSATRVRVAKEGDGHLVMVAGAGAPPGVTSEASEVDVGVIPPPSDFMDRPATPPPPQEAEALPPSNEKPGAPVDSKPEPPKSTHVPPKLSSPALGPCPLKSPPPEAAEPRSPPAVAPKPKKLPTNIILKSHKAAADHSEHLVQNSSDWHMPDPQRVRIEALIKLGLLPAEADPGGAPGHILSPKSRRSWAPPLSPITPRPPLTPPYTCVNGSSPARGPPRPPGATAPSATSGAPAEHPQLVPAPRASIDSVRPPPPGYGLRADAGARQATGNARVATPPHASSAPVKLQTASKAVRTKSATLERPGLVLSRNRPRQASLGGLKEFTSAGGEASALGRADGGEPELRRSPPAHNGLQHIGEASPKPPRSQGVSVLICPHAGNEGDRRQALKKLGLLRD
ncbi:uncharacterized protein AB9W97_018489 isoform 2-T2 [Spinachia spinachia]